MHPCQKIQAGQKEDGLAEKHEMGGNGRAEPDPPLLSFSVTFFSSSHTPLATISSFASASLPSLSTLSFEIIAFADHHCVAFTTFRIITPSAHIQNKKAWPRKRPCLFHTITITTTTTYHSHQKKKTTSFLTSHFLQHSPIRSFTQPHPLHTL